MYIRFYRTQAHGLKLSFGVCLLIGLTNGKQYNELYLIQFICYCIIITLNNQFIEFDCIFILLKRFEWVVQLGFSQVTYLLLPKIY